jgi:ribonuclease R
LAKRRKDPAEPATLPSREAIRDFIRRSPGRVGKREVEREFGLGPDTRIALRGLLKDLAAEGSIAPAGHRRFAQPGRLPDATIVQITGTDPGGDAIGRPLQWEGDGAPPMVLMAPERAGQAALAPGERVLAKLRLISGGKYEGRTLKRLTDTPGRVLGVFRRTPPGGGRIQPTDRRQKAEWQVAPSEMGEAEDGEIVLAEPMPSRTYGLKSARIVERLGRMGDARSVSLVCIHTHDIPDTFPAEAIAQAEAAGPTPLGNREDLRAIPLVTIDGEDARDFDDAVFAEAVEDGHRLIVAIADVAHYVPAGSPLDRSAWERGNSVYFPDRVVPMLPEALSNGWCSLRPDEDRGCLFVDMRIDAAGRKTSHRFGRGLMRSVARLTYEQVQTAHDAGDDLGLPLPALYTAFRALLAARDARGTLDLDLPERKVSLDERGQVVAITPRPRLDSHRLIEEFMVLANVAAAEALEKLRLACMYRIHAPPSDEKMEALRSFLYGMDVTLPPQGQVHPRDLDAVLKQVADTDAAPLVNEVMLRSQSQAQYSPENIGHFGLALSHYAHFTSPIRRYADLCVHRALIRGMGFGSGGLSDGEMARFQETADHITATERRAALAERDAIDRYLAAFMADKTGAQFTARISGVTRFGLFVTLVTNGASGLVPVSALSDDFWIHDEAKKSLTGRRSGLVFRLAQIVEVRLSEASPVTGGLLFAMAAEAPKPRKHIRT